MKLRLAMIIVVALIAACGEKKDAKDKPGGGGGATAGCGPMSVTIDGKAVEGLTHAFAFTQKDSDGDGDKSNEQIHVYNHAGANCAQMLGTEGREIAPGEIVIRAVVGNTITTRGVGINFYSQLDIDVKLTSPAPSKLGDTVTMCIPRTEMTPVGDGIEAGKKVVISGTVTGTWCGAMTL